MLLAIMKYVISHKHYEIWIAKLEIISTKAIIFAVSLLNFIEVLWLILEYCKWCFPISAISYHTHHETALLHSTEVLRFLLMVPNPGKLSLVQQLSILLLLSICCSLTPCLISHNDRAYCICFFPFDEFKSAWYTLSHLGEMGVWVTVHVAQWLLLVQFLTT